MDGYTLSYDYANGVKLSYTQVFFHPRGMPGSGQTTFVYGTKGGSRSGYGDRLFAGPRNQAGGPGRDACRRIATRI